MANSILQPIRESIAETYKKCKERGWDDLIDDDMLKTVVKGGYYNDNNTHIGMEEGYKSYYDYLKYGNKPKQEEPIMVENNKGDENIMMGKDLITYYNNELYKCYKEYAKIYDNCKKENREESIDDKLLERVAKGGYIHDNGFDGVEEGYKPYYDYLKYGNKPQQEEPIMIENNSYNYETPYSFEYESYLLDNNNYSITFDHEIDTSDSIQIIEELYNEEPIEEVDSDDVINIMDILTNKVKEVKKTIIHYISNYRPIMNQYSHNIDTILIE